MLPWFLFFGPTNAADDSLNVQKPLVAKDSAEIPRQTIEPPPPTKDKKTNHGATISAPRAYGIEIPAGILFGKFEKENGPFLIKGSVIVPSGEVLEFGPGCLIFMGGDYPTITVFGQIIMKGSASDPVIVQSALPTPNPWDWDRIYCRSRNRSVFEHCIIRHSNYGIFAENGSLSISECLFERNSLHGLVAKNSDVSISRSTFAKGHVLAVFCMPGADVRAESLFVNGNITGIACAEKSHFEMQGGRICNNTFGLAVMRGSSAAIVAADITRNKIGILSQLQIPRSMCEMSYGNSLDTKIVDAPEMEQMLRSPEGVKSIVLPQTATEIAVKQDFKAGFSAIKAPREETRSFIGNVTAGFKYFAPNSHKVSYYDHLSNSRRDTLAIQTRYPGEDAPGFADKIQPEMQIFASGKQGNANVDLIADVYGNQYMGFRRNMTSLTMNYSNQALALGDFYENFSETSINGRKLTGVKFDGNFIEMGKGVKQVSVQAAFGQSEMAKERGDHELDLYNQNVDSGMSIRQQLTYVASMIYRPTFSSAISVKGIIGRDQGYNTFIGGKAVTDPKAPGLVESQTGCIDGKIDLLGGKLSLVAELDMGTHDTITDSTHASELTKIAWYDPQIPEAVSNVFGVIPSGRNYAASAGAIGLFNGYNCILNFTQIAPDYFSAGNPYLEVDRRTLSLNIDKEFSRKLSGTINVEYQRRAIHNVSPTDNTSANLNTKYGFGDNLPEVALGYTFNVESSPRTDSDSLGVPINYNFRDIKNLLSVEGKQQLKNGVDYGARYQLLDENDITAYPTITSTVSRDGLQNLVSAWLGFKIGKLLRNKIMARYVTKKRAQDTLNGKTYKISDDVRFTFIPRKLTCDLKAEYGKRVDNKSESEGDTFVKRDEITFTNGIEAEVKYSFNSRMSLSIMGRYEKNEDTETFTDNYTVEIFGLHLTYLF